LQACSLTLAVVPGTAADPSATLARPRLQAVVSALPQCRFNLKVRT